VDTPQRPFVDARRVYIASPLYYASLLGLDRILWELIDEQAGKLG